MVYILYGYDFESSSFQAVRLVADYKINLRGVDYDSPEYQKLKSEV